MKDKKKAEIYDIVCDAVDVKLRVESDRLFNKIAHLLSIDINENNKMKEYIKVLESNILEMQRRLEKHDNETGSGE